MFKRIIVKYVLFISLLLGFVIRLVSIHQSFWMDEAISAKVVKNFSFIGIITDFIKADTHPPLYYLILKIWSGIFGFSELSLRFPSVIFGVGLVYVIYLIGSGFNQRTAIYSAILTAFSPLLIYYSQETRMYALSTLLVAICVYFFLKRYWYRFSLSLLLLGTTDYLPLLILFVFWSVYLVANKNRDDFKNFLLAHVPLAIFLIFWLPILNIQRTSTLSSLKSLPGWGVLLGQSGIKNLLLVWIKFLIGRINFSPLIIYSGVIVGTSIIALYGLFKSIKDYRKTGILIIWLILPILLSFVVSLKIPGFSYFRLLFTLPAFILLITYGFSTTKNGGLIFSLFLITQILFSSIYLFNKNYWREDWKTAVPFIESKLSPGQYVYVAYPESFTPYEWYTKKSDSVRSLNYYEPQEKSLFTLDYLMDLNDPDRTFDSKLKMLGYENTEVYNFRGVGQVRYWVKN
jgi:uncharacterized membrane protein